MATSHKVDMYIAAAETQHRSQYMLFTPSYIVLPGIIVTRQPTKGESVTRGAATDETEPSIDGLKDLAGKRVAVVNRYSWHDFLEELHPEITPVPVKNTLEGLQKVAFGEVDAMIDYQFNITEKINNSGIRNLRAAGSIDAPYGHAFGIRKDWPELHSIINKALSKITPEERRIIAQKWLQPYEKKAFSKQTIWMMLFAAEVLFTVFAFVLYWNFSLKRQVSRRTAQLNQELAKYDRAEKELRESRAMLEQSNVELEHRVNERTRDLQAINAELQLAKEAADAATTAKSQFLANISHEIRTPLHGIMAFAELALLKEKTPPHRYLRAILQSSRALLEIINDLLDVSKIEAGHLELEQAPFMLDDVVHHVCTVALHNAHAGGIELVVDMDPNMQIALIGDAGRLQQIIMNLVTNAVKFTGPGGQICVTLKQGHAEPLPSDTCPEQRRVQIICFVRDTGVGIAPEFLGQLFQPFRQVDASTTRRHGGTGLGLCICRQLVEMMRGEIWVESEPNVGSTFAFSIPLCTQPDSGATAQLPPPPAQPIHALVLSASPLQTEILCRHFSALGIDALTATNTEEAVRKAQDLPKKQPDLLFLDRKLSEPNTLYALRALRTAFGRTIPAILMDEHAGEQILSVSNRDAAQHDGQVAILSLVTLRGLHESIVSLNEPCLVAYSGRLHPQPSPMETPLFHDVRILVAEDNPTNQEIMEALFEDTGVQLTIVSNGKQALDALRVGAQRGERFDLVLMDVQMPVMDGYEATRIIRTMPELEGLPHRRDHGPRHARGQNAGAFRRDRPVPFEAPQPRSPVRHAAGAAPEQNPAAQARTGHAQIGIRGTFRPHRTQQHGPAPLPRRRSHRTPQRFTGDVPENPAGLCAQHLRSPARPAQGAVPRSRHARTGAVPPGVGMAHPRGPQPERRIRQRGGHRRAAGRPCSGARAQAVRQAIGERRRRNGGAGADLLPAARRAGGGLRHRADIRTGSPP